MELAGLKEKTEASNVKTSVDEPEGPEGILHFKSIPRTGEPGKFDVQYPTFSPNAATGLNTIDAVFVAEFATFAFDASHKVRLPTISHVVSGLAEIEDFEIVDARIVISKGQSDLRHQRAILI